MPSYCGNPNFYGLDIISAFSNVKSGFESFSPVMYHVYWNERLTKNLHDSYIFHAKMVYYVNFCILKWDLFSCLKILLLFVEYFKLTSDGFWRNVHSLNFFYSLSLSLSLSTLILSYQSQTLKQNYYSIMLRSKSCFCIISFSLMYFMKIDKL